MNRNRKTTRTCCSLGNLLAMIYGVTNSFIALTLS